MIRFDAGEVAAVGVDLGKIGYTSTGAMIEVFEESAETLTKTWAALARETSGTVGRHYPESIDWERLIGADIAVEIGPNPAKPQGNMDFEYGRGRQATPHLSGQRAADYELPLLQRRIEKRVDVILAAAGF